jgi:hypothetical protein
MLLRFFAFLAIASALSGCGSDDSGSSAPTPNLKRDYWVTDAGGSHPIDQLPSAESTAVRALAQAVCDAIEPCCKKAGRTRDRFCADNGADLLAHELLEIRSAGAQLDAAALDACRTQLAAAVATCQAEARPQLLLTCSAAFPGTTAAGQPCTSDAQCSRPAGSFALCKNGGVEAGRCVNGACALACDAPANPFDTWKTCDPGGDDETFCIDRCWTPSAPGLCQAVCWCCVDNYNQTCEFTALQSADNYDHYLCTGGRYSPTCMEAERQARATCESL